MFENSWTGAKGGGALSCIHDCSSMAVGSFSYRPQVRRGKVCKLRVRRVSCSKIARRCPRAEAFQTCADRFTHILHMSRYLTALAAAATDDTPVAGTVGSEKTSVFPTAKKVAMRMSRNAARAALR